MSIEPTYSTNQKRYVGDFTIKGGQLGRTVFSSGNSFDQNSTPAEISNRYIIDPTADPSTFNLARISNPVTDTTVIPGYKFWIANRNATNSLEIYETSTNTLFLELLPEFTAIITAESVGSTGSTPDVWKTLMVAPTINLPPTLTFPYRVNNTVFVDPQYGDNSTGERENPFAAFTDIQSAINAANTGDTINVRPGNYTVSTTYNLAGKELKVFFEMGAILQVNAGVYAFGPDSASYEVIGFPTFEITSGTGGVLELTSGSFGPTRMEILEIETTGSARFFNITQLMATLPYIRIRNNMLMDGVAAGSYLLRAHGHVLTFDAVGLARGGEHSIILVENPTTGNLLPGSIKFSTIQNLSATANGSVVFTETTGTRGTSFAVQIGKVTGNSAITNHINLTNSLEQSVFEAHYLEDAEINLDGALASFLNIEISRSRSTIRDSNTNTLTLNLYAQVLDTLEFTGLGDLTGHMAIDRLTTLTDNSSTNSTINWSLHSVRFLTTAVNGATHSGNIGLFENTTLINFNFDFLRIGGCKGSLTFQSLTDRVFDLGSIEGNLTLDDCDGITCQVGNIDGTLTLTGSNNINLNAENIPQLNLLSSTLLNLTINRVNYDQSFNEGIVFDSGSDGKIWINQCRGNVNLTLNSDLQLHIQHLKNIDANTTNHGIEQIGTNGHLTCSIDYIEGYQRAISIVNSQQVVNFEVETIQDCANGLFYEDTTATITDLYFSVKSTRVDTSAHPSSTFLGNCIHLDIDQVTNCFFKCQRIRTEQTLGTTAFNFSTQTNSTLELEVKNFESAVVERYMEISNSVQVRSYCLDCQMTNATTAATTVFTINNTRPHLIQGRHLNDNGNTNEGIVYPAPLTADLINLDCLFFVTTNAINTAGTLNLQTEDYFVSNQGSSGTVNFLIAAFNKLSQVGISY